MTSKNIKQEIINTINSFPEDKLNLLRSKTFLKPLIKLMIRDSILSEIELDDGLTRELCQNFFKGLNITTEQNKTRYLKENLLEDQDLERIATSTYRLNKISLKLFGDKSNDFFEKRKSQLNQFVYSFLQVDNSDLAQELYHKIESNESDFPSVASQYSLGPEKYKKGLVGPIPYSKINPEIRKILSSGEQGIVKEPISIGRNWVILRLEKIIHAEFNENMKNMMSKELFELMVERFTREVIQQVTENKFSNLSLDN